MDTKSNFTTLNRTLGGLKSKLQRITKYWDSLEVAPGKELEIELKFKTLIKTQEESQHLRQAYYQLPEESDISEKESDLDVLDDALEELEVRFKTLLSTFKVTENVDKSSILGPSKVRVTLPAISLPEFSGNYENWEIFKSKFNSLISNNDDLSSQEKLHYLQASLKGEAKQLQTANDSYESLLQALKQRYENKRLISSTHINAILSLNKVNSESAKDLRNLVDSITKHIRALELLNLKNDKLSEQLLINVILTKIDRETRKQYEMTLKSNELPDWDEFMAYLNKRCQILENISASKVTDKIPFLPKFPPKTKTLLLNQNDGNNKCVICTKSLHPVFRCEKFLQLTPQKRFELIRSHKLCELCLRKNHKKFECRSTYVCLCGERHSKSICTRQSPAPGFQSRIMPDVSEINNQGKNSSSEINSPVIHNTVLSNVSNQNKMSVLLSTGNIYLQNNQGEFVRVIALYDSASSTNIISRKMSELLGLRLEKMQTSVSGLNSMKQNLKGKLSTFISNESGSFKEPIEFLITDKITDLNSNVNLDISKVKIPEFLELADPLFFETKEIHALLNADIFFRIMKDNVYKVNEELLFRESEFGWVAGGRLNEIKSNEEQSCFILKNESTIEDTLKLFFELESLGIKDDPCFREEDQAMKIFEQTVRYKNKRYIVELPFRKHWKELSDNLPVAKQRFLNLWRRLQKSNDLYSQYQETIQDYLNQGIVEKVENSEVNVDRPIYYLPHQPVKKEGRVTTSTRLVFDAASHQANELSLNDCLWPGPNLYPNLFDILVQFRLNRFVVSSDIRQAFLQICLTDNHKDALRFLWTDSDPSVDKKPNLHVYHFNRVPFGVNASPFLLAATVKHHIEKYKVEHPITVQHLDSYMYVDDWITGQDTREEALIMSRCAKNIMMEAGMVMRKWISNDSTLMNQWAEEGFETYPVDTSVSLGSDKTKVLGMAWQTRDDCLTLDTQGLLEFTLANDITKRFLLQAIGKIFDPLGLLTPFTVRMKCLIQELWEEKFMWDEKLPPKIVERWLTWCKELPLLDELRIPRLVLDSNNEDNDVIEIHVFCDASKLAYGASVYVKVKKQNQVLVNLITSKSRVAPLKSVTLPRLELLGALMAARLSCKVQKIIGVKRKCTVFHWTDAQIVLYWIKGSTKRWKQFVFNRVQEITKLTDPDTWFHCAGKDNPADFLSRGLSAESLLHCDKWWRGPSFLQNDDLSETLCECPVPKEEEYLPELKSKNCDNVVLTVNDSRTLFDNLVNLSNRYLTIIRISSFLFRFVYNCRNPQNKRQGPLTSHELMGAENFLLRQYQSGEFSKEMAALMSGGSVSKKSKILNLSPFLDEKGVIRVGGRLENSQLSYSSKHPILLPSKGKFTEIIVSYYHEKYFHLGPQNLLFQVRQKYWPIHGRNLCKKIVHNCIICFKANPKVCSQKMGNLPKQRITPDKVFSSTGIDLCGPFLIKNKFQRKGPEIKVYVCIFICLVTKAIHLEIISDLTSQALIATLKRFISRRGKCLKIFSDNGTNMVGANRELRALFKLVTEQEDSLFAFFAEENIEWVFIPPRSPNWGGLWEANIKGFKYHFKRVAGNSRFTYEELLTLVTQIEGILNSRPLTPLSADSNDLEVLTPAHFLVGRPITAIIEPSLTNVEMNRLNAWQRITKSVQTIWKRWSLSYLNNLQQRGKWVESKENLKIGDMVLIREENLPPCKWLLGRVVALYPGRDNKVRLVDVKTCKGIYKRSISRLSVLPIEN